MSFTFSACGDSDDVAFEWSGDWNDPDDPNYRSGGYNPVQGVWVSKKYPEISLYFTEDFKIYQIETPKSGYFSLYGVEPLATYTINDAAFRAADKGVTWRYRFDRSKLLITTGLNGDSAWEEYTFLWK